MERIDFCLKTGRLYESSEHHNAVFVGRDQENHPRYAALRGVGTDFIGEASGESAGWLPVPHLGCLAPLFQ